VYVRERLPAMVAGLEVISESAALDQVEVWRSRLDELLVRVGEHVFRREARMRLRDYVKGLLAQVGRKNTWQIAEYVGHATPDGLRHLLARAVWDPEKVRDELRDYVVEHLGAHGGVLIDRELYLPKVWMDDPERSRAAGIPAEREFATKPQIARSVLARLVEAEVPARWIAADEAYGQDYRFRRGVEQLGLGYVLAVPKSQQVRAFGARRRIDELIGLAPAQAWERASCGDGAKGPRVYDWVAGELPLVPDHDYEGAPVGRWMLARRSLTGDREIAYYLAYGPADTDVAELIRVAGARWAIEECFQAAKNECGLDQYEVRRYPGWYRHITLAMLAHAFLAVQAADAAERGASAAVNPWSSSCRWQRSAGSWRLSAC
jgi:SRSO17 transposase